MGWSETVTAFPEVGSRGAIIDGFEDHMHDLLDDFVPHARNAKFAHLAVWLRYELLPHRSEAELLAFHLLNDLADRSEGEAIKCFCVCSGRHVTGFRFEALVSNDVQIFSVHQSI